MMAQSDLVVVGIDVAKDKADAYIRPLSEGRTFPNSSVGQRQLTAWLRRHKVGKAVMEASGGYERKGEASRHFFAAGSRATVAESTDVDLGQYASELGISENPVH